jgi:hypothetical protein
VRCHTRQRALERYGNGHTVLSLVPITKFQYELTYEIKSCQVIRIIPLQIIANLNSPGLEELIGMRKKLHIDRLVS